MAGEGESGDRPEQPRPGDLPHAPPPGPDAPPPPPAVPSPEPSPLRALAWAGGVVVLVVLAGVVAAPHVGDESASYISGRIFGALLFGFVLATLGRGLLVRLRALSGPVFAPSLLYIAAGFVLVTLLLRAFGDWRDDEERASGSDGTAAQCDTPAEKVLDRPPANGYVIARLAKEEEEPIRRIFSPSERDDGEIRGVTRSGQRVALVFALPGASPSTAADEMREGARDRGADPVSRSVAVGTQVAEYVEWETDGQGVAAIVGSSGCVTFIVVGGEKRHVKPVAETVGAELDPE